MIWHVGLDTFTAGFRIFIVFIDLVAGAIADRLVNERR